MTRYAIQLADFMVLRQREPALGIVLAAARAGLGVGQPGGFAGKTDQDDMNTFSLRNFRSHCAESSDM